MAKSEAVHPNATGVSSTQRFQATVRKQGVNPYVDAPERTSLAFAPYARAGRIAFEGELNGVPIRGALIPIGKGRHRLYVNGGMRSAAGVGVGDAVSFSIRATHAQEVHPPSDVVEGLEHAAGAMAAFDALPPSHRRELLRYVDDARTPETRRRRIQKTVEHALGKESKAAPRRTDRPLWTCPNCGNEFVNKNQYHSCRRHTLDELFAGKPESIRRLFDRFREMVEACGAVKVLPYRDKVGFMVRVRFAGAVPKSRWMDAGLWLPRRVDDPRFLKVETITPTVHVHLLRVVEASQLDEQVAGWIREAYAVGCQEHLR